jgi:RNA polymerase sigma factor CnrH
MSESDPDLPLVEALQSGDSKALDVLMERHQTRMFHFILRHIPDEAEAQGLAQEVFVRAFFHISQFQPKALFSTWLFQIALNLCRDHVRSRAWRQRRTTDSLSEAGREGEETSDHDIPDVQPGPVEQIQNRERLREVQQAIDRLPLELKGPLVLTAVDGLSHEEAGRMLGISAKAIEVKIYRARKKLLSWLESLT